ncbi:unnamed protein product [Nyctereutes procyonoides]|uniref:(raccoon dog) hypothetical protein n=1 Tax=Nyctereutes procyonoides TaxID=34880 RepID=A0A811ZR45_NYCPR|nr:unnamed protein product [Nyctereutes procyonoides]
MFYCVELGDNAASKTCVLFSLLRNNFPDFPCQA